MPRKKEYEGANGKTRKTKPRPKAPRFSDRMQALLDGDMRIEDLDDEEIFKGRIRAEDGTFRGTTTAYIPRQFYEALTMELHKRWQQKVNENLEPALKVLNEIMNNPRLPADARYKSAVYMIERSAGKVSEKAEMKIELSKWEKDIANGVIFD